MKKIILISLSAILPLTTVWFYYSNQVKEAAVDADEQSNIEKPAKVDARETVWDQLSARQKEEIDGTWSDGKITRVTLSENSGMRAIGDTDYTGNVVYFIGFPSLHSATIGDVIVYADVNTSEIIGYGLRD